MCIIPLEIVVQVWYNIIKIREAENPRPQKGIFNMNAKYFLKSESHDLLVYKELDFSEALKMATGLAEFIEEPVYIVSVIDGKRFFKIEHIK